MAWGELAEPGAVPSAHSWGRVWPLGRPALPQIPTFLQFPAYNSDRTADDKAANRCTDRSADDKAANRGTNNCAANHIARHCRADCVAVCRADCACVRDDCRDLDIRAREQRRNLDIRVREERRDPDIRLW
eukprot:gene11665-biopygen4730